MHITLTITLTVPQAVALFFLFASPGNRWHEPANNLGDAADAARRGRHERPADDERPAA